MRNKTAETIRKFLMSITAGLTIQNAYAQAAPPGPPSAPYQGWCPGCGPMMGWGHMGWLGFAMMLLFWIVIIAGIIVLVRWLTSGAPAARRGQEESALDVLKKRYARGEISKEEFEEKKRDLA